MAYEHTEAVVLKQVDFSETSRIVTLLTPYRGRMACMVKGLRRKGSPLAPVFDTFNHVDLTLAWKDSRTVQTLIEASAVNGFGYIKSDILRSASASCVLETALLASAEGGANPELFTALLEGLGRLNRENAAGPDEAVRSIFHILEASGIVPGGESLEELPAARGYDGRKSLAVRNALEALERGHQPSPDCVIPTLDFLNDYTAWHFERPLRSGAFMRSLLR